MDDRGTVVQFTAGKEGFLFFQSILLTTGTHLALFRKVVEAFSPGVKHWGLKLTTHAI